MIRLCDPTVEVRGRLGYYWVYGWTSVVWTVDGVFPSRELVGIYWWRWQARRAADRWLDAQ